MTPEGKGWGLRSLEDLSEGTFVCEYVREIVTNSELFDRNEQNKAEKHTHTVLLDADWNSEGFLKDEQALLWMQHLLEMLNASSTIGMLYFLSSFCGCVCMLHVQYICNTDLIFNTNTTFYEESKERKKKVWCIELIMQKG